MRQRFLQVIGSAAVLLAVGACSEEPSLYLGGPPGPDARQDLSSSSLTIVIGDSVVLGARTEDEVGNATATAPTVSACSGEVAVGSAGPASNFTTSVWVRGVGLGETCLVVASGGGIQDTVRATVGPAGVVMVGPATLISAQGSDYTLEFYDAAGSLLTGTAPVVWETTDSSRLRVDQAGAVSSPGLIGTARVVVRAAGGAIADLSVEVLPGTFTGTIANVQGGTASGDFADTIVVKPGTRAWDGNEFVTIGGVSPWLVERTTDSIVALVPAAAAGAQVVLVGNIGPGDFYGESSFTVNTAFTNVFPGPDISGGPFPMEFFSRLTSQQSNTVRPIYTLDQTGEAALDITVTLSWQALDAQWNEIEDTDDTDHDMYFIDCPFTQFLNTDGASADFPEEVSVTIPADDCWLMQFRWFADPRSNVMLKVTITSP